MKFTLFSSFKTSWKLAMEIRSIVLPRLFLNSHLVLKMLAYCFISQYFWDYPTNKLVREPQHRPQSQAVTNDLSALSTLKSHTGRLGDRTGH